MDSDNNQEHDDASVDEDDEQYCDEKGGAKHPPPVRTYLPVVTSCMKWWVAIFLGILFFIFAYGGTYNFTNAVWTSGCLPSYLCRPGCATTLGVFIHAILFMFVVRLLLY